MPITFRCAGRTLIGRRGGAALSGLLVAGVLLPVGGCGAVPAGSPPAPAGPAGLTVERPTGPYLHAAPLQSRGAARRDEIGLTLGSAASRVRLRVTDLPGLLYRVSTPAGSGLAPTVSVVDGTVRVALRPTGDDGPDTVDLLLNRTVRWRITLAAGAGEQHLDLAQGRISAVELGAGAGLVRMRLPRPSGTVPIRLTGTVGRTEIVAPRGVPVRVRAGGVLETVAVPWAARTGVPAGTVLTPPGWAATADRYRLEARMGVGTLTVRE